MSTNPSDVVTDVTASIARQIEAEDFRELFEGISPSMICHDAATQD
ncbi:hypothetical protein [Streptosporangium carneum]|uniref:Uncharacterized protein n=1 Tax=Streptosporangium carneum TaxID=47481 RepID=A0A9W6IAR1_9ACTN|nr:hypothetical protein [Streptosporangium carneum]GLK14932.1 hypothetical protein GCM10017600_83450 [Streptosporangium carneum]